MAKLFDVYKTDAWGKSAKADKLEAAKEALAKVEHATKRKKPATKAAPKKKGPRRKPGAKRKRKIDQAPTPN